MINENPSEARIRDVAQSEEIEEIGEKTMSETSEEITSEENTSEEITSEASVEITSEVSIMNQIIVRIMSVATDTTVRIEVGLPIIAKKDTKTIKIRNLPKVIRIMTIIIVSQINFLIVVANRQ